MIAEVVQMLQHSALLAIIVTKKLKRVYILNTKEKNEVITNIDDASLKRSLNVTRHNF